MNESRNDERSAAAGATGATPEPEAIVEVDARGLEPPQPMVRILEALTGLGEGTGLRARTDRRPIHLFAALAARGFTAVSEEQPDGSFVTLIRHQR